MTEKKSRRRSTTKDYTTISPEAYKSFQKATKLTHIDRATWRSVIYMYNQMLVEHLINTGEKVRLPHGLGMLHIRKQRKKMEWVVVGGKKVLKNAPIDWQATRKAGKLVYYQNFHTEGYTCRFVWSRRGVNFKNADCWNFQVCREAKRKLAAHLKSGEARRSLERYEELTKED